MIDPKISRFPTLRERNLLYRLGFKDTKEANVPSGGMLRTPYLDALAKAYRNQVAKLRVAYEGHIAKLDSASRAAQKRLGLLFKSPKESIASLPAADAARNEIGYQAEFLARQEATARQREQSELAGSIKNAEAEACDSSATVAAQLVLLREHAEAWLSAYRAGVYAAKPEYANRIAPFEDDGLFEDDVENQLIRVAGEHGRLLGESTPILPFGDAEKSAKHLSEAVNTTPQLIIPSAQEAQHV